MAGSVFKEMQRLNKQFETFIRLQNEAKEEAVKAAEAAEKALKKETATIKALNLTYNKKGKLVRNGSVLVNEFGQEVNRVGEVVSNFNKRTTVLTKAIEDLNNQGKAFEVFSKQTRKAYMDAGGNMFEFLAEAIAGTREEITIFGQEGAKIRKIMYGFLPPGTFRALNKASSILQALGSATRRASRSTQDYKDDIEKLKTAQSKLNKDTQEEEYNNLQDTIDKMREDMNKGGGNILGTTVKALGKIPRMGKFTKAFGKTREQTTKGVQADLLRSGRIGMTVDGAKARKKELQKKGLNRTQGETDELIELLNILKPLGLIGLGMDSIITSLEGYGDFFISLEENFKKFGGFIFKAWKKAFPEGLIKGLGNFVKIGMKFMFSVMIYATMLFALVYFFRRPINTAISAVGQLVKEQLPAFKESMMNSFNLIKDSFMDIYNGFKDGDLLQVFEGIWGVAWGVLSATFKVLMAVGAVALIGLGAFIGDFFMRILEWLDQTWTAFWNGEWKTVLKKIGIAVAVLALIFAFWPTVIAAAIIGGVVALVKFFKSRFFADGGTTPAGMSIVGERGPEILNLPAGSKITSNAKSRKMTGGTVNNFNITINAKDSSKAEMRRMADEIGRMINSKINRSTSSSTFR